MEITAIILAGGKSKRMGTDKAQLKLDGVSLLERSIKLCEGFASEILISSNFDNHARYGFPVIADEIENCGPLGGIYSCLKRSGNKLNFVISVDAAFVTTEFVEYLMNETENVDALVPYAARGKEPLIAFYNKSCLPKMKESLENGDYKMHDLLQALQTKFVNTQDWVDKLPKLFHNLNRPEDLVD